MPVNYVRFQRGSEEAYNALKTAGKLDENTLYFIYKTSDANIGTLYMGTRVISGGDITIASARLDDLADVVVAGAGTNSFLVKDTNDHWVARSLDEVIALIRKGVDDIDQVFQTIVMDGESDQDAINRITKGKLLASGDIAIVKALTENGKYQHSSYVYDGLNWIILDNYKLFNDAKISNIEKELSALKDVTHFITAVDDANFSVDNGTLNLKAVAVQQVTGLPEILDSKVDAIEGSRLINANEILLLESIANGDFFKGFITDVDDAVFSIEDGVLNLKAVPKNALQVLGDFDTLPHANEDYTLIGEINELYKILTWIDMIE